MASGRGLPLEELARLREAAYRFLAASLLYPGPDWLATLPPLARALGQETRALTVFPFWGTWARLLDALGELEGPGETGVAADYIATLGPTAADAACPARESAYVRPADVPGLMAALRADYAREGFSLAPGFAEPLDHVATELEFMGLLCAVEGEAWQRRDPTAAVTQLERQSAFLESHPGRWIPEWAGRVALHDPGGFFSLAAAAAWAFVAHDSDLVRELAGGFERIAR